LTNNPSPIDNICLNDSNDHRKETTDKMINFNDNNKDLMANENQKSMDKMNVHLNELNWENVEFRCNILISIGPQKDKYSFIDCAQLLIKMGFVIYATDNTYSFFTQHLIPCILTRKPSSGEKSNVLDLISAGIHLVINVPANVNNYERTDGYHIRRKAVDFNVPLISNVQLAKLFVRSLAKKYLKSYEYHFDTEFMHIKSWREYMTAANRV